MNGHVKIGREFFAKIKLDYANWRYALAREFLQNCFDAPGCRNVDVTVRREGADTVLVVSNDGAPMDRATLETKLLTLGGSGKNFDGENTGGFGVAKSLLYYTHKSYAIRTGNLTVNGTGAEYTITEGERFGGTASVVTLDGDEVDRLVDEFKRFAAYAQWRGTLTVNGKPLACDLHKGARRRDLGWGVVYTNKSYSNVCVVRLNGQPMFTTYTRFAGCVIVELTGKAREVLTSNRDGLTGSYPGELSNFLTALAIDKRSALREQRAEYKRYLGEKMRNEARKPKAAEDGIAAIVNVADLIEKIGGPGPSPVWVDPGNGEGGEGEPRPDAPAEPTPSAESGGGIKMVIVSRSDEPDRTVSLGPEFIIKNTTGKKPAPRWIPGPKFKAGKLVKAWTAVLLKLYQLLDRSGEFSVGFVFDDESEAEAEKTGAYGLVYYVNPLKKGEPRFDNPWASRHSLISLAAHEVVHGAMGYKEHDEDYASALTDVLAVVTENLTDLSELCWDGDDPRTPTITKSDVEEMYLASIFQLDRYEKEIARLEAKLKAGK